MEFKCKNCGALYIGEETPVELECTCECKDFECLTPVEVPTEFEQESN